MDPPAQCAQPIIAQARREQRGHRRARQLLGGPSVKGCGQGLRAMGLRAMGLHRSSMSTFSILKYASSEAFASSNSMKA